ncbi:MAG: hypothetical protein WCY92_08680 [Novosphingobium sp.]
MHLAYLDQERSPLDRRTMLRGGILGAGCLAAAGLTGAASAATGAPSGAGTRSLATGQKWIDAFFHEGAQGVAAYYADEFVFEDIILGQMINTKDDLLRAFEPFDNYGPDSPLGVHQFDIIRYNGGVRNNQADEFQVGTPQGYDAAYWDEKTRDARAGATIDYDEWAIMHWLWKVQHNADFLGMPAKGKTTHTRGVTHHLYRNGKITQEYSYWNYRDVAIQLGVLPQPASRHELSFDKKE